MLSRPFQGVDEPRRPGGAAKACHPTLLLLGLAALAPAGCGLADYEKKMREADARLQRFDEENKLLDNPLALPSNGPPVDVFLRPPKGIAKDPSNQPGDIQYHFAGTGGLCSDLYLVFGDADTGKDKLMERFGAAGLGWQPVEVRPPDRPPIGFDFAEFTESRAPANAQAVFIAYVHQTAGRAPVGLVFRVAQSNRAGIEPTVKRSLESYAEAGDAAKARADFAKRTSR